MSGSNARARLPARRQRIMREHTVPTLLRPPALRRAVILFAVAWAAIGAGTAHAGGSVTVMTQNLYQGTEFAHIRVLAQGKTRSFDDALAATTADYATYVATRFKDRAKQIAAEIVAEQTRARRPSGGRHLAQGSIQPRSTRLHCRPPSAKTSPTCSSKRSRLTGCITRPSPDATRTTSRWPSPSSRTNLPWAYCRRHGRERRDPRPDRSSCRGS